MAGRIIPILALSGVALTAHFAMFGLAKANGTFDFPFILAYKNRVLAGGNIPINFVATGFAPLDNYVAFMIDVFWVVLNPKNIGSHLQGHHFLGTLSASWILMLIEAHRVERTTSFLLLTYVMETVGELLGLGFLTPLWCIAHLIMTAAPSSKNKAVSPSNALDFLPQASSLGALGYAYFFGQLLPTLLMGFTAPDGEGIRSQQAWVIIRLFHPLLTVGLWRLFQTFASKSNNGSVWLSAAAVRKFYTFAIVFSAVQHAMCLAIVFAEFWIPGYLRPEIQSLLGSNYALLPTQFWGQDVAKAATFAQGVSTFLHWDETLVMTSIVIWAASLYIETSRNTQLSSGRLSLILQTALMSVSAGPAAGAAFLLQERDNLVLADLEGKIRKTK